MPNISDYKSIALGLIQNEENKTLYNNRVLADNAYNNKWDLPASLANMDWITKRIIKVPFDTVEAGKSAYSTMEPSFNIVRPGSTEADNLRFNNVENLLSYQFMCADRRRGGGLVADMLQDILLYGEGVIQPIHLDTQLELMGETNPNKLRGIRKGGDFILNVHNAKHVRVRYTDMGIDGVLLIKIQTVAEFEAFWGKKAKPIMDKRADKLNNDKHYVCVYDYTDWENRAVWANLQETRNAYGTESVDGLKIMLEPHKLPFLPWAARRTPNRKGLLDSILASGAWDVANQTETLMHSESISYASAPRFAIKSASGDYTIHYGEPGNYIDLKPGDEIIPLQPPPIDQSLAILSDRVRADMQLVPDIVLSGDAPPGSAFASINQLMQSGLHKFTPYREVGERLIEDVGLLMINWAKYLGKPLYSPIKGKRGVRQGRFELETDTYEYDGLEMKVELKPDMPVDRMAQIQAASQGVQFLGWTRTYANEQLAENDPEELDRQSALQAIKDTKLQGLLQKVQAEDSLEAQLILAGMSDLLELAQSPEGAALIGQLKQMAAQQQAAPQTGEPPPGEGSAPNPETPPGLDGVGGAGFDPNSGGIPSAMAVPGTGSQSMATNRDRQGGQA